MEVDVVRLQLSRFSHQMSRSVCVRRRLKPVDCQRQRSAYSTVRSSHCRGTWYCVQGNGRRCRDGVIVGAAQCRTNIVDCGDGQGFGAIAVVIDHLADSIELMSAGRIHTR